MSISVAPSFTASAVSATFTSMRACDDGKLPDTQATSTPSTSRVSLTTFAKQGYTQIVATCGRSPNASSNSFTFSVKASTLSSESVVFRVVSSMLPMRNLFTSRLSFSCTFSVMIFFTASRTSLSSRFVLYLLRASSYLLAFGVAAFRVLSAFGVSFSVIIIKLFLFCFLFCFLIPYPFPVRCRVG